jgi:voltage-dependent calcium channel L type alpha-1D
VANISCFLLMEWFIVAILGVQLFKGRFYLCSNGEMVIEGTINCQDGGTAANFDNTWEALLTVMELSTLEDWPSYMYHGIDAQPYPKPPVRDAYPANALFFVGFVICGAMFTLNLVVSAIVNHYLAFKEECEGRGLTLSEDQYRWVQSTRLMLRFKLERRPLAPTQPEGIPWLRRLRRRVFRLVHKQRFDNFISLCILISVILMLCSHFDASDTFENVTEGINAVLSFIFLCEALLKLFGLVRLPCCRPAVYFRLEGTNCFCLVAKKSEMGSHTPRPSRAAGDVCRASEGTSACRGTFSTSPSCARRSSAWASC